MATGLAVRISTRILLFFSIVALAATAVAAAVVSREANLFGPAGCEGHGGAVAVFESVPARARGTSVRCADGTVDVLTGPQAEADERIF